MKKIVFTLLCFISFHLSYSQTVKEDPKITPKTKTLILSTVDLTERSVDDLKNELVGWDEKVVSLTIKQETRELVLVHNILMDQTDLFDVLKKYDIKKEKILSYK